MIQKIKFLKYEKILLIEKSFFSIFTFLSHYRLFERNYCVPLKVMNWDGFKLQMCKKKPFEENEWGRDQGLYLDMLEGGWRTKNHVQNFPIFCDSTKTFFSSYQG